MAKWDLSKLPEGRKPLPDEWYTGRIAELEQQLRISETVREIIGDGRDRTFVYMQQRIEELEAKLAKAVEVAEKSIKWLRLYGADVHREATTLAELKGGNDE